MMACNWNRVDCVRALVAARADVTMRDNRGRTALDHARNGGDDIVQLLETL